MAGNPTWLYRTMGTALHGKLLLLLPPPLRQLAVLNEGKDSLEWHLAVSSSAARAACRPDALSSRTATLCCTTLGPKFDLKGGLSKRCCITIARSKSFLGQRTKEDHDLRSKSFNRVPSIDSIEIDTITAPNQEGLKAWERQTLLLLDTVVIVELSVCHSSIAYTISLGTQELSHQEARMAMGETKPADKMEGTARRERRQEDYLSPLEPESFPSSLADDIPMTRNTTEGNLHR